MKIVTVESPEAKRRRLLIELGAVADATDSLFEEYKELDGTHTMRSQLNCKTEECINMLAEQEQRVMIQ